jgi:hypothetical protein
MDWNPIPYSPGQWVIIKSVSGTATHYRYYWVEAGGGDTVAIWNQELDEDLRRGKTPSVQYTPANRANGKGAPPGGEYVREVIGDQTLMVWRVDFKTGPVAHFVSMYSNEIPIQSPVKTVRYDETGAVEGSSEVIDFGLTGGAERPRK